MKRMIGLLMVVGLVVGVVGCGDDDNPVKSNQDLDPVVGTWSNEDGDSITFRSDGTFVDWEEDEGTWSLVGDQFTFTYNDPDYAELGGTFTLISVTDDELTLATKDGESWVSTRQISTPTESSVPQDKYSETIVGGTWKDGGEPIWTFIADGTVVYDGYEDNNYTWSIVDSTLTVSDKDGEVFARYEITSLSNAEFVFVDPDYPKIKTTHTR